MIKYTGHYVTFQEVPDEVSLMLTISNCLGTCEGCHSPWLREDIGDDLEKDLPILLGRYGNAVSCVCFMGEGNDRDALRRCISTVHEIGIRTALYTGRDDVDVTNPSQMTQYAYPDYIKTGSYQKDLGGLDNPTTNQRMYRYQSSGYKDITERFRKHEQV